MRRVRARGLQARTPAVGYDVPLKFTGQIEKVVLHLGETKLRAADQKSLMAAEARSRAAE